MTKLDRRGFLRLGAVTATTASAAAVLGSCGLGSKGTAEAGAVTKGVTVVDQRGVRVHLDRPARRVITIPIPTASMLMCIENGSSCLVGMNPSSEQAIDEGILNDIYPRARSIPTGVCDSSFNPDVETILNLNPDVVIQWASMGAGIITPLENAGINVIGLDYGTQDDLVTWIRLFGAILGKQARAASFNQHMANVLSEVKQSAPSGGVVRPKILYFESVLSALTVAGTETYNDYYINLIGGRNAAAKVTGTPTVDVEQVIVWDPDIILVGNFDAATPANVTKNPSLASVSAVRTNRVYKIPLGGYRWDPPSQESPLMWRWLAELAYPNRKSPTNLRDDIVSDYKLLYSYHPSESQIDGILQMDLNGSAANYGRFRS